MLGRRVNTDLTSSLRALSIADLRAILEKIDYFERGDAAQVVTECLKRIMDELFFKESSNEPK